MIDKMIFLFYFEYFARWSSRAKESPTETNRKLTKWMYNEKSFLNNDEIRFEIWNFVFFTRK